MAYIEHQPHPALAPYIDAYWQVTGGNMPVAVETILPDGCVDILVNLGEDELPGPDGFFMKNEHCYLVGTMSRAIETSISPRSHLAGIRFRPAGFAAFYQYGSLHEYTDRTVEFDNSIVPELRRTGNGPHDGLHGGLKCYLDEFFLRRLPGRQPQLMPVITEIESRNGMIDVPALARNHCVTVRQLQRTFKMHIGLSPKEFLNVIRFRYALRLIKSNAGLTLLDIALEAGYYDHAHLSNEIRKHAGVAPSLL